MPSDETLADAVKAYQSWRKSRGYADSTHKRDGNTLTGLLRIAGRIKASSLSTSHIDAFFLERSVLSPQTQNLDLTTLRNFFMFLENRGYHRKATSLLLDYRPLKYAPAPRRRIPIGEFPAVLDCAERRRDRALMALGLYLFLRASEIKLLRIKDVSLATDEVSVRIPKTKDADVMPMSAELARELRAWLTYYGEQAGELDPEWYLIPGIVLREWDRHPDGRMIRPEDPELIPTRPVSTPERVVQKALARHGWTVTHREGVHTLRRSGARALYDELAASDGHSNALETVSAMLHHKVMATTQIYLGLTESRRKRDRLIRGRLMFPSLGDTTVTPLPARSGEAAHG